MNVHPFNAEEDLFPDTCANNTPIYDPDVPVSTRGEYLNGHGGGGGGAVVFDEDNTRMRRGDLSGVGRSFHPQRPSEDDDDGTAVSSLPQYSPSHTASGSAAAAPAASTPSPAPAVFDRLYALRDNSRLHDSNTKNFAEQLASELEPCTFSPALPSSRRYLHNKQTAAAVPVEHEVRGVDKTVQRMRSVQEKKLQQKEEAENTHLVEHEKYVRSREMSKQGCKPFSFTLAERRRKEEAAKASKAVAPK